MQYHSTRGHSYYYHDWYKPICAVNCDFLSIPSSTPSPCVAVKEASGILSDTSLSCCAFDGVEKCTVPEFSTRWFIVISWTDQASILAMGPMACHLKVGFGRYTEEQGLIWPTNPHQTRPTMTLPCYLRQVERFNAYKLSFIGVHAALLVLC